MRRYSNNRLAGQSTAPAQRERMASEESERNHIKQRHRDSIELKRIHESHKTHYRTLLPILPYLLFPFFPLARRICACSPLYASLYDSIITMARPFLFFRRLASHPTLPASPPLARLPCQWPASQCTIARPQCSVISPGICMLHGQFIRCRRMCGAKRRPAKTGRHNRNG